MPGAADSGTAAGKETDAAGSSHSVRGPVKLPIADKPAIETGAAMGKHDAVAVTAAAPIAALAEAPAVLRPVAADSVRLAVLEAALVLVSAAVEGGPTSDEAVRIRMPIKGSLTPRRTTRSRSRIRPRKRIRNRSPIRRRMTRSRSRMAIEQDRAAVVDEAFPALADRSAVNLVARASVGRAAAGLEGEAATNPATNRTISQRWP